MFWLKDICILWFLFLFLYRFTACACPISCFATQVDEDHLVWLGSWDGVMTLLDLRQRRFHVPSFCLTPLSSMWIWFILLYRRIYMAYLYILHINNKMSCSLCWIFILVLIRHYFVWCIVAPCVWGYMMTQSHLSGQTVDIDPLILTFLLQTPTPTHFLSLKKLRSLHDGWYMYLSRCLALGVSPEPPSKPQTNKSKKKKKKESEEEVF